jgi:hypothetical protein
MRGKLAMGGPILGAAWGAYRRLGRLTSLECSFADAPTKILITRPDTSKLFEDPNQPRVRT